MLKYHGLYLVGLLWNANQVMYWRISHIFCRLFPVSTEVNGICCEEHETVQNQTDLIISLKNASYEKRTKRALIINIFPTVKWWVAFCFDNSCLNFTLQFLQSIIDPVQWTLRSLFDTMKLPCNSSSARLRSTI